MRNSFLTFLFLSLGFTALGQNVPKGFLVPDDTHSPDGRFGVTVPITDEFPDSSDPKNSLIDLKTGRILAVISSRWTGWSRQNHGEVLPSRWSKDGSLLLWEVDGKWFADAVVLLKLENENVVWQVDILKAAQEAILSRTKKAAPKEYGAAKEMNKDHGSAYPEGFSIDVIVEDPIALPLKIRIALTANPKGFVGGPELDSDMTAIVDSKGVFVPGDFQIVPSPRREIFRNF